MTTIAYRDGVLAGDTRASNEQGVIFPDKVRKVHSLRNGLMVGLAGNVSDCQEFLRLLRAKEIKKLDNFKVQAIIVKPCGSVICVDEHGWSETVAPFCAIGSGYLAAIVAMRCGKNAIDAVKIASEFDKDTGPKVLSVRLKRRK